MSARTRSRQSASRGPCSRRTAHPTRNRLSYRESSTDSNDTASADEFYIEAPQPKRRRVSSAPSRGQMSARKLSTKRKATAIRRSRHALGAKKTTASMRGSNKKEEDGVLSLGGRVPPWQSLPYYILCEIFRYASSPILTDHFETTPSISWLLRIALLCRAFAEPALSALYWSPPLCPPTRAHGLISHLALQTKNSTFNYRAKVRYLEIEVLRTLIHKYGGRDPINLAELVTHTPQLRGVGLRLLPDVSMMNRANNNLVRGWSAPKAVFSDATILAMEQSQISLKEWKWNWYTTGIQYLPPRLKAIHSKLPFQSLEDLTLANYQPFISLKPGKPKHGLDLVVSAPMVSDTIEGQLAEAVTCLPGLKKLRLKWSDITNKQFLLGTPRNLELLEITDCYSINSELLSDFLLTHGQNIRELILDHNQALDLSFLVDFAVNCPKAEILKMDLTYYNSNLCYRDSDPKFTAILLKEEVPTWPSTLQHLELHHLRKWDIDTAELFFSSLVDSAALLPNLRHLDIKASLDESGWRERVAFRDRWVGRLETVFRRNSLPPSPYLKSIDAFKAYKAQTKKLNGVSSSINHPHRPDLRRKNSSRFSHVEVPSINTDAKGESQNDSDAPLILTRRTTRQTARLVKGTPGASVTVETASRPRRSPHRRRHRKRNQDWDSSSDDSALEDDSLELETQPSSFQTDEKELYIQGMCDIVHVVIDNLRPMEEQLNESNFLDEEVSGDEDWVGDDSMPDDQGYAW